MAVQRNAFSLYVSASPPRGLGLRERMCRCCCRRAVDLPFCSNSRENCDLLQGTRATESQRIKNACGWELTAVAASAVAAAVAPAGARAVAAVVAAAAEADFGFSLAFLQLTALHRKLPLSCSCLLAATSTLHLQREG
ncbi:hypothetical protein cyc_07875 [Cyclospora cayetanensis]|uniref:Uncharacterized protein n=1 Tax=Cyclospora cayetanensis TaxID=88456 RepID=A0A1D3CRZ8_9EIME|nr:hypothetical protein cyc_07875 [Cyclospora cayetanensis]